MKVRANPDGSFTADLRVAGKGPQLKFSSFEEADLRVSQAKVAAATNEAIEEGRTLKAACAVFLEDCRLNEFSEFTLVSYERWLKNHVVPHLPPFLSQIDVKVVGAFRSLDRTNLVSCIRVIPIGLLDAILDHAVGEGWMSENPMDRLPEIRRRTLYNRPRNDQRLRLPTEEEFEACINTSSGVLRILIALGGLAGLRLGESLALRWGDVDLRRRKLLVRSASKLSGPRTGRAGTPKTSAGRRGVPIDRRLLAILSELESALKPDDEDFVCQGSKTAHLTRKEAYGLLNTLLRKLRIARWAPGIRENRPAYAFHAFRHACVSRWIHANIALPTIMRWIGHVHPQTTIDIYAYQIRSAAMQRHRSEGLKDTALSVSDQPLKPTGGN